MNKISTLDILVPVYNEEDCLESFVKRLFSSMSGVSYSSKVLFVDDGSSDRSFAIIEKICNEDPRCGFIKLSRNFGKEAAMTAGIHHSKSDALVIIDADLQDPPELIPQMVAQLEEHQADVVYARRRKRHGDSWLKRSCAYAFYYVFDHMSRFTFPRDTGDFRVIRRRVVLALQQLLETNRFMKGMFAWVGYNQVEFLYDRDLRYGGNSKFNFLKLLDFAFDGITAFTTIPLKLASYIGSIIAFLSICVGIYFFLKTLIWGDPVQGFPSLIIVLSLLSGVQLMFLGVLGEYVGRTNVEVKQRPLYLIDKTQPPRDISSKTL